MSLRQRAFRRFLRHPLDPGTHWIFPIQIRRILNVVMRRYGNKPSDP
jgi:hypothetical protein